MDCNVLQGDALELLRTLRDEGEDKAFQEARRMLREEKHKR